MFRSLLFHHLQGPAFRAQCCYYFSACLRRQVVYLVCGCMLSMCVRARCTCLWDVWVWLLLLCLFTSSSCLFGMWLYVVYVRHAYTQTTYSHIPNKQLDNTNKQRSSNSTKHERRPSEDGQTIVTETCRVLIMRFTNIFKNLVF